MKNMPGYILKTLLVTIGAITVVIILVLISNQEINHKNGFTRRFYKSSVLMENHLKLPPKIRSLCKGPGIYFDTDTAGLLASTDSMLAGLHWVRVQIPNTDSVNSLFTCYVDSPFVYIFAGNIPAVLRVNMDTHETAYKRFPGHTFTRAAFIKNSVYAFRLYEKIVGKWEQQFIKGNTESGKIVREKSVSERRGDAGLSTDGLLHFDETLNTLVYVNYYRNHFMCMDTSLSLLHRFHTIDTNSSFRITAGVSTSGALSEMTNTSPVKDVNLQSCVSQGKLFIVSALQADNETTADFKNNSVADVYSLTTGQYDSSFYIPFFNTERLKEIKVSNSRIIVLYPHFAAIYTLPKDL